jgi:putative FmdB family regulatory protein|tara:strand:+ start:267 stop:677 length:411 start_codon:yes stop_codon:yes gene_type:complete
MPLYEFKCQSCGAEFEHIASFSECDTIAKEMQCSCGGDVKKLLSIPAFTPERWGDGTGKYGVNGFKCVQSGMRFQNKREQFKWMEKNGKVCVNGTKHDTVAAEHAYVKKLNDADAESVKTQEYLNKHRSLVRRKKK